MRAGCALATDGALVASTLVGGAALCRMVAGGVGGAASGPVLVTAAAGCVVPGVLLWRQVRAPLAAAVGAVAVALVALWSTVPGATRGGLPTATTLRIVRSDLRASRADLSAFRVPLHASPGIVVLGALLAGMTAVAARTTFGSPATGAPRWPAAALVPPAALVTWSTVADPGVGSAVLVAALIATGSATVALAAPAGSGLSSTGPHASGQARRRRLRSGAVVCVLAMAVAVGVGAATGTRGAAANGSSGSSGSTGSAPASVVPPTGLALASDLLGLERRDPSVVLFWARSPVPTYWQVGVLTQWQDGRWLPDGATADALRGAPTPPGSAPGLPPSSSRTFDVTVTVGHLSSRLLPVPPTTTDVDVPGGATITAAGALAARASTLDERYGATAVVPPAVSASPGPGATGLSTAQLAPDLALGAVSPVVTALARQVTAVATTPLARAEALVDWFRSGDFRYTLTPPGPPPGTDPLVAFLTTVRAGTCEAFAGAFAVMARSLGLPTRVAVGFTGGRAGSGGTTTVRGADAHEWPEVYLGAALGWVSFEPTPQLPSGELSPPSVVGPTGIQVPITIPPASGPVPTTTAAPTPTSGSVPASLGRGSGVPGTSTTSAGVGTWPAVGGGVVVVLAAALVLVTWRRRQRRRVASAVERVLRAYVRAERGLGRAHMARPLWRTPPAHARGLLARAQGPPVQPGWGRDPRTLAAADELLAALRDLLGLAELLESAHYGTTALTRDGVVQAEGAAKRIRRTLRRRQVRALARQVAAGRFDPEPARPT